MKKTNIFLGGLTLALGMLTVTSCKDGTKTDQNENDAHITTGHKAGAIQQTEQASGKIQPGGELAALSSAVLDNYLELKEALVSDNVAEAASIAHRFNQQLAAVDISSLTAPQKMEVKELLQKAGALATRIKEEDIDRQREHFSLLSRHLIGIITITGSEKIVYQQYCPMYNNNQGAVWLSAKEEIRNPYFGNSMLRCGTVQKTFN